VKVTPVSEEIDISTGPQLRERLFELADSVRTLIVGLNRVTFIDSARLGALVGTVLRAAEHSGSLHAVCARPQTRMLLWMTGGGPADSAYGHGGRRADAHGGVPG
jgi:anti-anti-sigma factor